MALGDYHEDLGPDEASPESAVTPDKIRLVSPHGTAGEVGALSYTQTCENARPGGR